MDGPRLSIGKLGKRTGTKVETIRYYESVGVLPAPPRTEGGHRSYGAEHLETSGYRWNWRSRALTVALEPA